MTTLIGSRSYAVWIALLRSSVVLFTSGFQGDNFSSSSFGRLTGETFLQKVGKVLVDVYSIRLRHLYHCVDQGTCLRSRWNDCKQPVFASDDDLPDVTLGSIVGEVAASIQKIILQQNTFSKPSGCPLPVETDGSS